MCAGAGGWQEISRLLPWRVLNASFWVVQFSFGLVRPYLCLQSGYGACVFEDLRWRLRRHFPHGCKEIPRGGRPERKRHSVQVSCIWSKPFKSIQNLKIQWSQYSFFPKLNCSWDLDRWRIGYAPLQGCSCMTQSVQLTSSTMSARP